MRVPLENKTERVNPTKGAIDSPLVSIITQVFNGVKYLVPCLESVLNQSYSNMEHIFVDGGSTDGTVDLLISYQAKYPDRIRFISEPDKGAGDAWNKGWRIAKGGIFGWLGADDMSVPGAIQTVVEFFRNNPDAYFVFGDCNFINAGCEITGKSQAKDFNLKEMINDSNCIPCPSAFYRREVVDKVGWLGNLGNDREYWIRAGKLFTIHRIEEVLSSFRIHEGSESTGSSKEIRKLWLREDCLTTRHYGGSIFAGYCRRYYKFLIIEGLRPVLGFAYPALKKVLRK